MQLFHLSGVILRAGSVIEPGNYGRIVRATGESHTHWDREQALEEARQKRYLQKPSRLEAAFVSIDEKEARSFRSRIPGFTHHILYCVRLEDPTAPTHLMDSRLCASQSSVQYDWADLYWRDYDPDGIIIPRKGTLRTVTNNVPCRELLTTSALIIEGSLL